MRDAHVPTLAADGWEFGGGGGAIKKIWMEMALMSHINGV